MAALLIVLESGGARACGGLFREDPRGGAVVDNVDVKEGAGGGGGASASSWPG